MCSILGGSYPNNRVLKLQYPDQYDQSRWVGNDPIGQHSFLSGIYKFRVHPHVDSSAHGLYVPQSDHMPVVFLEDVPSAKAYQSYLWLEQAHTYLILLLLIQWSHIRSEHIQADFVHQYYLAVLASDLFRVTPAVLAEISGACKRWSNREIGIKSWEALGQGQTKDNLLREVENSVFLLVCNGHHGSLRSLYHQCEG